MYSNMSVCNLMYCLDLLELTLHNREIFRCIYPQGFGYQMVLVVTEVGFIFAIIVIFGNFYWYCKLSYEEKARAVWFSEVSLE